MSAKFDLDLRDGHGYESKLADLLRLKGPLIEVKHDRECKETGNVFVEFEDRGRSSGVAITTAHWWVFWTDEDTAAIVGAERLKDIARTIYQERGWVPGGDNKQAKGVLIPAYKLLRR